MKKWGNLKPPRLVEKEFKEFASDMKKYGENKFIFVGSSIDMFAKSIPSEWLQRVFRTCYEYNNTYLFQSKNPGRFLDFVYPFEVMFGTTLESNRDYEGMSKAPKIDERVRAMINLRNDGKRTMVTIEPVLNFDMGELVAMLNTMDPEWVNLGADSGDNKLPEPSKEKLLELMDLIQYRKKKNLQRLLK